MTVRFLTRKTTLTRRSLCKEVQPLGFPIREHEILSAAFAGVLYLRELGNPRCRLILREESRPEFAEFVVDEENPEVIVVGDDVEADIGSAQRQGIAGILVKTGKYLTEVARRSSVVPDYVIESIASLRELF